MDKNLYMILVVVSRVAGLYLCVANCFAILTGGFMRAAGHMPMQGAITVVWILGFILGAALLFLAKPIARALTSDLESK